MNKSKICATLMLCMVMVLTPVSGTKPWEQPNLAQSHHLDIKHSFWNYFKNAEGTIDKEKLGEVAAKMCDWQPSIEAAAKESDDYKQMWYACQNYDDTNDKYTGGKSADEWIAFIQEDDDFVDECEDEFAEYVAYAFKLWSESNPAPTKGKSRSTSDVRRHAARSTEGSSDSDNTKRRLAKAFKAARESLQGNATPPSTRRPTQSTRSMEHISAHSNKRTVGNHPDSPATVGEIKKTK
jgi:hypothetical protein